MTTSDGDGSIPFDPDPPSTDDVFPVTPAYGSRALGDGVDVPVEPPPAPVDVPVIAVEPPPAPVEIPVVPAEPTSAEQETVVLAAPAAAAAYHADDVLPVAPVGGRRRAIEDDEPRRTTPTRLGRALLPLGLALVSAVALVAGWMHLQDDRTSGTAAPITSSPAASPSTSGSATVSPSVSPSVSTSVSPSETASATSSSPSPSTTASGAPVASSPAASPSAKVDRSVDVVVLNSTPRTGLAARVAASLRKDGWTVVQVGNYRGGRLAVTTVFARGRADAVATMGDDLAGRSATKQPTGSMNPARITVVIGANYPRS
jgi:hypothetical protein